MYTLHSIYYEFEFGGENVDEKICENKYFSNYRRSDIHYFLFYCSERILYIHKFLLLFDIYYKNYIKMDAEVLKELESLREEINDLRDSLDEKDYQILHIMTELDNIKSQI